MIKFLLFGFVGALGYFAGRAYTISQGTDFFIMRTNPAGIVEYIQANPDGTLKFVQLQNLATRFDGLTALKIRNLLRNLSQDNAPIRIQKTLDAIVQQSTI